MGSWMYNDDEGEYEAFLQQIIDSDHLEGASLGIAKLVRTKGKEVLSSRQAHVFKRDVEDVYITDGCDNCGNDIPWSEMFEAFDNGGNCGWCAHSLEKLERE